MESASAAAYLQSISSKRPRVAKRAAEPNSLEIGQPANKRFDSRNQSAPRNMESESQPTTPKGKQLSSRNPPPSVSSLTFVKPTGSSSTQFPARNPTPTVSTFTFHRPTGTSSCSSSEPTSLSVPSGSTSYSPPFNGLDFCGNNFTNISPLFRVQIIDSNSAVFFRCKYTGSLLESVRSGREKQSNHPFKQETNGFHQRLR